MRIVVISLMGSAAVALMLLGAFWKLLYPPESYWSIERARQYEQAFADVHRAQSVDAHGEPVAKDIDYAEARARYDALVRDLEQARNARDRTGKYLAAAGLALLLGAIFLRHKWPAAAS